MSPVSSWRRPRALATATMLFILALTTSACGVLDSVGGIFGEETEVETTTESANLGACLPTFGDGVFSASMSRDGQKVLVLSSEKPMTLSDDASWYSEDRAVYVLNFAEDGTKSTNVIVTTWPATESSQVPADATPDADGYAPDPGTLEEQMTVLELAQTGDRFVIATRRQGSSALMKLYTGVVPEGDANLSPGDGLSFVPINDFAANEMIQGFTLSPDGNRLAAVVGSPGEARVYDFNADEVTVYSLDEEGETVVSHELPRAPTSISDRRQPAIASSGTMRQAWSPDGNRLALSRTEGVALSGLWIMDVSTGETTLVRGFRNTTVPHAQWSGDGSSLFVLTTELATARPFGLSEVSRIAAEAAGDDLGDTWQLEPEPSFRTAPTDFTAYGDDQNFVFTWEYQLWHLALPASGTGSITYGPVTRPAPSDMSFASDQMAVGTGTISVAPDRDKASFVVEDISGSHVGQRLFVTDEQCPYDVATPEGEDAAAPEGEAEEGNAAEAEGEDAAGDEAEADTGAEGEDASGDESGEAEGEAEDEG